MSKRVVVSDDLLREAAAEIRALRDENRVLRAQMYVVEAFRAALLGPPQPMGESINVAWQLEREADREPDPE